jgi:hypothetical protein
VVQHLGSTSGVALLVNLLSALEIPDKHLHLLDLVVFVAGRYLNNGTLRPVRLRPLNWWRARCRTLALRCAAVGTCRRCGAELVSTLFAFCEGHSFVLVVGCVGLTPSAGGAAVSAHPHWNDGVHITATARRRAGWRRLPGASGHPGFQSCGTPRAPCQMRQTSIVRGLSRTRYTIR